MAPTYLNTRTNVIDDLPENIGNHPVLGRDLVLYVEGADTEIEEEKVVHADAIHSSAKVERKASRKSFIPELTTTPEQEG